MVTVASSSSPVKEIPVSSHKTLRPVPQVPSRLATGNDAQTRQAGTSDDATVTQSGDGNTANIGQGAIDQGGFAATGTSSGNSATVEQTGDNNDGASAGTSGFALDGAVIAQGIDGTADGAHRHGDPDWRPQ